MAAPIFDAAADRLSLVDAHGLAFVLVFMSGHLVRERHWVLGRASGSTGRKDKNDRHHNAHDRGAPNFRLSRRRGGEAILGANVFRDIFAGITDIIGGRSAAYEASLAEARETAMRELEARAAAAGGNAVVGVDLDYEVVNNMLMVSVSGTSVTIA